MKIGIESRTLVLLTIALMVGIFTLSDTTLANGSSSEIFENISYDKSSLRFAETLDDFETVTVNPDVFLKDAEDGRVKLRLIGKEFNLELEKIHIVDDNATINIENETGNYIIPAPKSDSYIGKVVGKENSNVLLTVSDDVLIGSIELENTSYVIEQTNKTVDGKVILVVYNSNNIKEIENPEFAYCGVDEPISSVARKEKETNLDDSINNDSKTLKENSPNVNNSSKGKSSVISATPGFGILGSLACLYVGFKLKRK